MCLEKVILYRNILSCLFVVDESKIVQVSGIILSEGYWMRLGFLTESKLGLNMALVALIQLR